MRSSLADQRQEPRERGTRRQQERREGRGRAARIAAVEEHASDGETEQGDAEKDGGARVDEQHLHTDRRKRKAEHPTRMPQEEEEERERDGHENMAVERSRLAEQRERPSVPRRKRDSGNRRGQHGRSEPRRAEQCEASLVHDRERDRSDRA